MSETGQTTTSERPYRISPTHQADLRRYFREGFRYFEQGSSFGAQLERLQMFGEHARPCGHCGGDAQSNTPGTGFITDGEEFKGYLRAAGLFDVPVDVQAWLKKHNPTHRERWVRDADGHSRKETYLDGEVTCPRCKGRGWVSGARNRSRGPLTARPTRSSVQGNGVPDTGGTENMAWLGLMSRRVGSVRSVSYGAAESLAAFFDPAGGSIAALWHLTPSGLTMLRENGQGLPQRQFFENLRAEQERNPKDKRRRQFEAADAQARALHDAMHRAWGIAVGDIQPEQAA